MAEFIVASMGCIDRSLPFFHRPVRLPPFHPDNWQTVRACGIIKDRKQTNHLETFCLKWTNETIYRLRVVDPKKMAVWIRKYDHFAIQRPIEGGFAS